MLHEFFMMDKMYRFCLFMNDLFCISEGILFDIVTEVDWDVY